MADDQNQKPFDTAQGKSSTIDDLVKELSKNNKPDSPSSPSANQPDTSRYPTSPASDGAGPPPNLPGVKLPAADLDKSVKPQGPVPSSQRLEPPKTPPPQTPIRPFGPVGMQKPPVAPTVPPKSPVSSGPVPAPQRQGNLGSGTAGHPVQEYKSSIRTMGEDITSIKSGQKPSGVDVPRKVTPEMPTAPMPGTPKQEFSPTGPKQVIGLGQTEKSGTLPGIPKPKAPASSGQGQVGLGQAGKTGPLPAAPTPQKPAGPLKPPGIQPSVTVPSEKKGISRTLYLAIAGILVVGGFLYWFFVMRAPAPEVVLSPTPTPTVTPTPVVRPLTGIFTGNPVNFEVGLSENIGNDFKTFVDTLTVANGDFLKVNLVQDVNGTLVSLDWLDVFDMALTVYPFGLKDVIADSVILVYGQSEIFNEDGTIDSSTYLRPQDTENIVFVARVTDVTGINTMMSDWELTIADDLADYLLIDDTSKEESVNFLDNAYRGVAIRYKNFPFPDITVDYAIVEAAGQNYLVIAGSREAMYATIDALLEQ